jgi:methionine-rich copper-binding protein CopC
VLSLRFSEAPELALAMVTLTGPDGAVALGKPARAADSTGPAAANTAVVPVSGTIAPGSYTVAWKVASKDGHPVSGTFRFVLRVPVEREDSTEVP